MARELGWLHPDNDRLSFASGVADRIKSTGRLRAHDGVHRRRAPSGRNGTFYRYGRFHLERQGPRDCGPFELDFQYRINGEFASVRRTD
jgi:hypothetical protein